MSDSSMFKVLRDLDTVFHNDCTNFYHHQQCTNVAFLHISNLLYLAFLIVAILTGVN